MIDRVWRRPRRGLSIQGLLTLVFFAVLGLVIARHFDKFAESERVVLCGRYELAGKYPYGTERIDGHLVCVFRDVRGRVVARRRLP